MIISWIINTLSRDISESVLYVQTAYQLWSELNDRYGQANGAKLYQLQKSLCEISQGNNDIATYVTKVKCIWDELGALSIVTPCTCGNSQLIAKQEANQRLIQFLMGLNPMYDTIKGNILMMEPLPSTSQAYALLLQDEKQKEIHVVSPLNAEAIEMNVHAQLRGTSYGINDGKKSVVCSHCNKSGHTASKCYRLIGFPNDFKFTKPKRFASNISVNDVSDVSEQMTNSGVKPMSLNASFTVDQCQELLQLLHRTCLCNNGSSSQANVSTPLPISSANFAGPFSEEASGSW